MQAVSTEDLTVGILCMSQQFAKSVRLLEPLQPQVSLMRALGKAYDENLHSDFLATLLSPECVGQLAYRLFDMLHAIGRDGSTACGQATFQFSYREVRLDQLNPNLEGTQRGARRIDVLVKRRNAVLLIENKVWSLESESQTADYFDAVSGSPYAKDYEGKSRWIASYLFLSPDGTEPAHPKFVAISYEDLYQCLVSLIDGGTWSEDGARVLNLNATEIGELLVRAKRERLRAINIKLTEAGYDV
jgi:hypothetical protein